MSNVEWPIFAFREDGVIQILESIDAVKRSCDGRDWDAGVWAFYDFSGCPLEPVFVRPNRYYTFLWLIHWSRPGDFKLEKVCPQGRDAIETALCESHALLPNPVFGSFPEVCAHLESRGHDLTSTRRMQSLTEE